MKTIYLDHNATTPIRPEVLDAMAECWRQGYANPASQHQAGQKARRVLEEAKERIAALLGAELSAPHPERLLLTSGGTESNNLAVLGIARAKAADRPGRVIVSATEHASVLGPAMRLLDEGWRVDTLPVDGQGVVRVEALAELLTPETRLVSVILGNHETGVLQPVAALAQRCRQAGVPLHTDAVQVVGKFPVDFRGLQVAAMTVAAHKFQGPIGIGALIVQEGVAVEPLFWGGHQQEGLRPGTELIPLAVGMRTALELWHQDREAHAQRMTALRERFEGTLRAALPEVVVHGSAAARLPQTSNIAFPGLDGQVLLMALDLVGVACSVGSACASGSSELSPTLLAMGVPRPLAGSSLRFSLGAGTTEEEIDEAVSRIVEVANQLR